MAKDKDTEFEALYRKHYARVFRFYRQANRLPDDIAHDLAQDVFIRAYRTIDQYRDGGWSFFETIARNVLYNWWRSNNAAKRSGKTLNLDDPDFKHQIAAEETPDYARREESARNWKRFRAAIAELPESQRIPVELQLTPMTYEEIAAHMGITMDAVKTRLKEAKKRLRLKLGDVEWPDRLPEDDQ